MTMIESQKREILERHKLLAHTLPQRQAHLRQQLKDLEIEIEKRDK